MSQTFFSKLDAYEKNNRLSQLANSRGLVTIWIKGEKDKIHRQVDHYIKDQEDLVLDSKDDFFPKGTKLLCSFEMRGMSFFAEAVFQKSIGNDAVLEIHQTLFKSEKRSSYRLLTFPVHDVWAEFDLGEIYEGGKVVNLKTRSSQTDLFKNFLHLMKGDEEAIQNGKIKIRLQDISTTGMSMHIGELENRFFLKDKVFNEVTLNFIDQKFILPEAKIVYVVDYISADRNLKKYKVGINFSKNSKDLDTQLGKKINEVIRESDKEKDFEKLIK
jgi:hypothetical protein